MVFHWSLSGSKFPQLSRTLLSIQADLNNAVVWTVSIRPIIVFQSATRVRTRLLDRDSPARFPLRHCVTLLVSEHVYSSTLAFILIRRLSIFEMTKPDIGLVVRVFVNGPGDLGSIPGRVIPKIQKMVLDSSLTDTQHYKVLIKEKLSNPGKGVAPSPTRWCSSYRKGSLQITLNYCRQLYLERNIALLRYISYFPNFGAFPKHNSVI